MLFVFLASSCTGLKQFLDEEPVIEEIEQEEVVETRPQPSLSDEDVLAIMLSKGYDIYGPRFRVIYKDRLIYGPNFVFTEEELAAINPSPEEEIFVEVVPEPVSEEVVEEVVEEIVEEIIEEKPAKKVIYIKYEEVPEAEAEFIVEEEPEELSEEPEIIDVVEEEPVEQWYVLEAYEPEPGWEPVLEIPSAGSDVFDILEQYNIYISSISVQEQEPMVRMTDYEAAGGEITPVEEVETTTETTMPSVEATIFEEPEVIVEEEPEIEITVPVEPVSEPEAKDSVFARILEILDWRIAIATAVMILIIIVLICSMNSKKKKKKD